MHKLKTVLRSSHRKRDSTSSQSPRQSYESSEAVSPRADRATNPPTYHGRSSVDAPSGFPQQGRRSRPVSATYDERRASNASAPHYVPTGSPVVQSQSTPSDSIHGSIANDYRSYLPALSPVQDSTTDSYMTLGGNKDIQVHEPDHQHGEDAADRNKDRYRSSIDASRNKALPVLPNTNSASATRSDQQTAIDVPPRTSSRYSVGQEIAARGDSVNNSRPYGDNQNSTAGSWKPKAHATLEPNAASPEEWNNRRSQKSEDDDRQPQLPTQYTSRDDMAVQPVNGTKRSKTTTNGSNNVSQDWQQQQKMLLDGVVDLKDTVDVDKEVQVAAPVIHEVVKPHEHEIIQKKIFREIHNYSYYHRIQPVMHTEVLPPRHFIPNPDGEGLIEISADELPSRTGKNRWWEIVQKEIPQTFEIQSRWRTEPEVIEGEPYITEEGFERRETTIIYPPTLEDMSEYDGVVQPVHFDHKTGKRWLGEVTTMTKLKEQYSQDMLTMNELKKNLPDVPANSTVSRKPLSV